MRKLPVIVLAFWYFASLAGCGAGRQDLRDSKTVYRACLAQQPGDLGACAAQQAQWWQARAAAEQSTKK